jgi:hypothetical protein
LDNSSRNPADNLNDQELVEIDNNQVLSDTANLESSFERGLSLADNAELEDDDDPEVLPAADKEDDLNVVKVTDKTRDALAWVDQFILDTRRKSGRVTENSVLKLWKVQVSHDLELDVDLFLYSRGFPSPLKLVIYPILL